MSRKHTAPTAFAVFAVGLALAAPLHAAPSDDAEASFTSALAAYDRAEYDEALRNFERAYALKPSYKLLYNIGLTQMARGDAARALDAFEGYLQQGGGKVPAARSNELKGTCANLRRKVGELVVESPSPGVTYTLDGSALDASALSRPVRANPGEHWLCRSNPEGEPTCRVARVLAEQRTTMRIAAPTSGALPSAPASQPVSPVGPTNPADSGPRGSNDTARWLAWSGAGVLAASAAVTGVLALGARSDEKDAENTRGITRGELDSAHSKTSQLALATDLLLAGAAVTAGVALYLQLSSPHDESGAARSSARLELKPTGVDFALRF